MLHSIIWPGRRGGHGLFISASAATKASGLAATDNDRHHAIMYCPEEVGGRQQMLLETSRGATDKETRKAWSYLRFDRTRILGIFAAALARIIRKIQEQGYVHESGQIAERFSLVGVAFIGGFGV